MLPIPKAGTSNGECIAKKVKAAENVDYPAYGVTGPSQESPHNDTKLARQAQRNHFRHHKGQILNNMSRAASSISESDEDVDVGDYTVYECPGLGAENNKVVMPITCEPKLCDKNLELHCIGWLEQDAGSFGFPEVAHSCAFPGEHCFLVKNTESSTGAGSSLALSAGLTKRTASARLPLN